MSHSKSGNKVFLASLKVAQHKKVTFISHLEVKKSFVSKTEQFLGQILNNSSEKNHVA
jgi:hypothetical protein